MNHEFPKDVAHGVTNISTASFCKFFYHRSLLYLQENHQGPYGMLCVIWYHSGNSKNVKNTYGRVLLLVKSQVKATLLHGYFSFFLNCTNSTKSHKASLTRPLNALDSGFILYKNYSTPQVTISMFPFIISILDRRSWLGLSWSRVLHLPRQTRSELTKRKRLNKQYFINYVNNFLLPI